MNNITPQLFVDRQKVKENIDKMVSKAKKKGVRFRPHFKTHQSAHIGEWFKDAGVSSITVSTIKMANYFAKNGWNDITVALPVNILEIEQINELSKKIQLNLTVTNKESIEFLKKELNGEVNIYIKVDTGNKRTGIAIENEKEMDEVVEALKGDHKLNFKGLMIHSGHTYYASSTYEIDIIHRQSVDQLKQLRKRYMSYFEDIELSVGYYAKGYRFLFCR
ncbi:MAG: alanine racemase [Flavobacteriales bacterium]